MKILFATFLFLLGFYFSPAQATKKIIFNKDAPFRILSSTRGITNQSSASDTFPCKNWAIAKRQLPGIIQNCNYISGTEWDLTFDVLPCIISGELKQKNNIFQFEINAGSWIYVRSTDTTITLGNYHKANQKFFLSKPYLE